MKKPIRKELLNELLAEYANPDDLTGPEGLLKGLTGALVERALVTKAKGHFPNDEAATKLLYLALRNAEKKWTMVPRFWNSALSQLVIYFSRRLPA